MGWLADWRHGGRCAKAAGSDVRGVTVPMAVPVMHAMAEDIRSEGGSIFFAAMEG